MLLFKFDYVNISYNNFVILGIISITSDDMKLSIQSLPQTIENSLDVEI